MMFLSHNLYPIQPVRLGTKLLNTPAQGIVVIIERHMPNKALRQPCHAPHEMQLQCSYTKMIVIELENQANSKIFENMFVCSKDRKHDEIKTIFRSGQ